MAQKQNSYVKKAFLELNCHMNLFKLIEHQLNTVQHYINAWGKDIYVI